MDSVDLIKDVAVEENESLDPSTWGVAPEIIEPIHRLIRYAIDMGYDKKTIAECFNRPRHHIDLLVKEAMPELATPKRVKNAGIVIDYFLDMKNYYIDEKMKPSDMLAATKIIVDRSHPVKRSEDVVINNTFTQCDIKVLQRITGE